MTTHHDPIALALIQNRLDHISRQMGWVMTRTARSPIFNQSHDFSCFIAAADGTLISQADGIPIHTGGGGFAVRAVLRDFGGRIEPEDVFLLNDPYAAGGNHLPDWVIARPVFVDGKLAGFACNRAHQSDIGGGAAGTYNSDATEIYHEGLRLPVLKLIERGTLREDLWALLKLNSRTPELLDGDVRAMIGSTRIGAERVAALLAEVGVESGLALVEGILDHADRRFRAAMAALPAGRYVAEEETDNDCFEQRRIVIRVAVTVGPDGTVVDFTGTDPQIRGFKNSSVANTWSAVYMALASFLDPDLPRNEGTFRSVRIVAPEGTIVNARPPAAMTMNTVFIAHEIVHAIWKALGQAAPQRACAGWGKSQHNGSAGRIGSDRPFVAYHWHALAAAGAVNGRDGFNQIGLLSALGGLTIPNAEGYEQAYPLRITKHEFRCDAAGPGKFRGGTGIDYEVEVLEPAEYSFRSEGVGYRTGFGVDGGGWGECGTIALTETGGKKIDPPRYGVRSYGALTERASSSGGGGWGDPLTRDPAHVLRDVRDGVVSGRAANDVYGVVLSGDGKRVDSAATETRRTALRRAAE
jgi:N-methylhydantoinase B